MTYTQIEINTSNQEQTEILIAQLSNIGFEGFEETENSLQAFIKKEEFRGADVDEILNAHHLTYTTKEIAQQNWNAQWESSFEPVVVDDFVAVRASFHEPITNVKHEIIVTPKMSFGTGHHATTFLMMQQMSTIDFTNKSVFDFGTGTGVLAILAEKLGAIHVDAIDNDEWSIENAKENVEANNCNKIYLTKADAIESVKQYDVVLANINLNVITAAIEQIVAICKPKSQVLFSGFLPSDFDQMNNLLLTHNFNNIKAIERNNWLCINCIYKQN
ncbi:MAG: 50S ribosomal protein L11 methyltransferase [Ferruginibacter sp.]|nr:50S ribosomal protein L11 methyltransferase [Ferruginibacter sp.]